MPDLDDLPDDDMMTSLFADVRHEVAGYIRPAGAAAAAATVKRRRRNRTIAVGALAVALVVGPAIGFAWAGNGPDRTPEVATTPTVGASASASETPGPAPSATASSGAAAPGIPADQLRNMTLTVPQWSAETPRIECPSGALTFTDGKTTKSGTGVLTLAGDPVHVDVDADGRSETVVRVDCQSQALFSQVVAFSRGPDGKASMLGRVVATHIDGSDVQKIWKIEAGGPTTVRVDVGDYSPCCDTPADLPQHQWRTYGWDGGKFRQTGGQTRFPPNPKTVDLLVRARPLSAVSSDGATWAGSVQASVTNNGPKDALNLQVHLKFGVEVTLSGPDAAGCQGATSRGTEFTCGLGKVADGQTRNLVFQVVAYADPRGTVTTVRASHGDAYPDRDYDNNEASATTPT